MNDAFRRVIAASDDERRDVFLTTARRLGTAVQNVEKDFWVCWTLDVLFNGLGEHHPRLLFKGGTSLSKSFGLINRFSEDIDITVFRNDLGEPASIDELEVLSGRKRHARLDAIKTACQAFISGPLLDNFREVMTDVMTSARISTTRYRAESDPADADQQTLLFWYPAVTAAPDDYIRSAVKIEAGAKSALDPNLLTDVRPYSADDLRDFDLQATGITTVEPKRTFWDKVVILHGLRTWDDRRGQTPQPTDLLLFVVVQDVTHAGVGTSVPRPRQRLGRRQLIAGFEVSINCRIWVSTEARVDRPAAGTTDTRPSDCILTANAVQDCPSASTISSDCWRG
jgi:hypothetical protein